MSKSLSVAFVLFAPIALVGQGFQPLPSVVILESHVDDIGAPIGHWPKYSTYCVSDRAPGVKPMKAGDAESEKWLSARWKNRPWFYLKKSVVAHEEKVIGLQDKYFSDIEMIRMHLSVAVAESQRLGLPLNAVEEVCTHEGALMKTRAWKMLKEREPRKRDAAKREIGDGVSKLREESDALFVAIEQAVAQEFAKWAAGNPAAAQALINDRRIKQAEKKAAVAQAQAANAEFRAQMAEAEAARARNEAAAAAAEASEANRRANDAQWRLSAAGVR